MVRLCEGKGKRHRTSDRLVATSSSSSDFSDWRIMALEGSGCEVENVSLCFRILMFPRTPRVFDT